MRLGHNPNTSCQNSLHLNSTTTQIEISHAADHRGTIQGGIAMIIKEYEEEYNKFIATKKEGEKMLWQT